MRSNPLFEDSHRSVAAPQKNIGPSQKATSPHMKESLAPHRHSTTIGAAYGDKRPWDKIFKIDLRLASAHVRHFS
jgi:hypothetical protein